MKFQSGKKFALALVAVAMISFASCNEEKTDSAESAAPATESVTPVESAPAPTPAAEATPAGGGDTSGQATIQGSDAPVSTSTATK